MEYDKYQNFDDRNHLANPRIKSEELNICVCNPINGKYQQVEECGKDREWNDQVQLNIRPELCQLPCSHTKQQCSDDYICKHLQEIS